MSALPVQILYLYMTKNVNPYFEKSPKIREIIGILGVMLIPG